MRETGIIRSVVAVTTMCHPRDAPMVHHLHFRSLTLLSNLRLYILVGSTYAYMLYLLMQSKEQER